MKIDKISNGKDGLSYITIRDLPKEGYIVLTLPIHLWEITIKDNHIHIRNRNDEGDFI